MFCLAGVGWVGSPLLVTLPLFANLSDPGVAMLCMLLLFLIPDGRGEGSALMDWDTAVKLPWGVLLLLGGGLALAGAIDDNGIGAALALHSAKLQGVPPVLVVVFAVVLMTFLTELTSNLASTATLVPVFAAMAGGMAIDPLAIIIPTALAASCAFMLPAATPPNSIVFGSGMLRIPDDGARWHLDQRVGDRGDLAAGLSAGRYAVLIRCGAGPSRRTRSDGPASLIPGSAPTGLPIWR